MQPNEEPAAEVKAPWSHETLEAIATVLAHTDTGLTGQQIGGSLKRLGFADPCSTGTKRFRLLEAFVDRQQRDGDPQRIIDFIVRVMDPVRYRDQPELFTLRQQQLNERLAFAGVRVTEAGRVVQVAVATTADEAAQIAESIWGELRRRRAHPELLRYCSVEVLQKAHFHACLEATKSIFARLRAMADAEGDGAALADATLALGKHGTPAVSINSLSTQIERDEQAGFANLVKGIYGMFRSPAAHEARRNRSMGEEELLEVLNVVSMAHRRLDGAHVRRLSDPRPPAQSSPFVAWPRREAPCGDTIDV